ncbi:MAG TPA: primosomal protein N', partial [Stellaceae bacterium]|nr:primosomal protein N' [Stellaceae bacterium]
MAEDAASLARPADCANAGDRLRVLLPLPLPAALDYRAADGAPPQPGRFVRVNLGPRRVIGVVWEGEADDVPEERLRPIVEVLPTPPLPEELRRFIDRVAAYTLAPPGMVLRMAMSVEAALLPPTPRRVCRITAAGLAALGEPPPKTLTPARRRVLDMLRDMP